MYPGTEKRQMHAYTYACIHKHVYPHTYICIYTYMQVKLSDALPRLRVCMQLTTCMYAVILVCKADCV